MSPFQFECSQCGKPLKTVTFQDYAKLCHRTNSSKFSSLDYIIHEIGGKCPSCGHKLQNPPLEVKVSGTAAKEKQAK